jgi:hypothetical protein
VQNKKNYIETVFMLSAKMTNKKERLLNSEMTEKEKKKEIFCQFCVIRHSYRDADLKCCKLNLIRHLHL